MAESSQSIMPASSPPLLCPSCEGVTMPLPGAHILLKDPELAEQMKGERLALRWVVRLPELIKATENGCAFCSFILDRFFCNPIADILWLYDPVKPWYADPDEKDKRGKKVQQAKELLESLDDSEFKFQVGPTSIDGKALPDYDRLGISVLQDESHDDETMGRIFRRPQTDVWVFAAEGDPAAELISTRPPEASPGSERSMKNIRAWMKECEETHEECRSAEKPLLPTRVIDISDETRLTLYISKPDEREDYATVSYCWGGPQDFQTTRSTLEERKSGFALEDLPNTLQDAVKVAQNLHLKYLWIDTICIVQDEGRDKGHEVAKMGDIYKNAKVTICAARSDDAQAGFLQDTADEKTGLWKNMFPMTYPIAHPDAVSLEEVFCMPRNVHGKIWLTDEAPFPMGVNRDPVSRRAWVLQEQLLSRRVLYYGRWPRLQCNRTNANNRGFGASTASADAIQKQRQMFSRAFHTFPSSESRKSGKIDLFSLNQLYKNWYEIVNDYSKRELSLPSDRLPAIAGIAAEFSRVTGADYAAGLWKNNILHDLMWTSGSKERLMRPEEWRAPTWSWASVDSVISYGHITEDSVPESKVLSCDVVPAFEGNPFGEVSGGTITLSGPLGKVTRENITKLLGDQGMAPSPPKNNDINAWDAALFDFIANMPNTVKDEEAKEKENPLPENIHVMLLFSRSWMMNPQTEKRAEVDCYSGLLLKGVGEGNYERIGAFTNERRPWLLDSTRMWPRETITIV